MIVNLHGAQTEVDLKNASISLLSRIIRCNWPKVSMHAEPYLQAMNSLNDMNSKYGADSADSIVIYFLSNASGWRGDVAKAVKAELKRRLPK